MSRPRSLDPSNLPAKPNIVTDPERVAKALEELNARARHLTASYRMARETEQRFPSFNESLERLERALNRKNRSSREDQRLNPEVETVISYHARRMAAERGAEVGPEDIERAAYKTLELLPKQRGRPYDRILHFHVAGLMALAQQFSGEPVLAHRFRNSVYDPHFPDQTSRYVLIMFGHIDQEVTVTQLVNATLAVRKEYAGKPLRFQALFPFYGATFDDNGEIKLRPGLKLEKFEQNIPIYYR